MTFNTTVTAPYENVLYAHDDPCMDLFFSRHYQELLLGVRHRATAGGEIEIDCVSHRLAFWPSDLELGRLIASELGAAQGYRQLPAVKPALPYPERKWTRSSATDIEDFNATFWSFCIWTKPDAELPLIIGAPLSAYYPEEIFGRQPIAKSEGVEQIGKKVRQFVQELMALLPLR